MRGFFEFPECFLVVRLVIVSVTDCWSCREGWGEEKAAFWTALGTQSSPLKGPQAPS